MRIIGKLILLLLVSVPLSITAQSWQEVGQGGFSDGEARSQSMAVDGLTPYVAYSDDSNNNQITVKKYNGTAWETVGDESFGESVDELDFSIQNGNFYIVYSAGNTISVMTLVGGEWVYEGPSPLANGDYVSISMWEGTPYIAYRDHDFAYELSVQELTTSGWAYLGGPGFSSNHPNVIDFEVDGMVVYVSFRDDDNDYKTSVMKFENDTWSVLGNEGFSGGSHDSVNALAIYNNEPYVASWNSDAQGVVYKYDGTNWQQVGSTISTGIGRSLTLQTSTLNELHIAYKDEGEGNQVYVKKFDGSDWLNVGEAASLLSATYVSMAFNTNGRPYLAYRDDWYTRRTTVMTYGATTSVEEVLDSSNIQVFPNPAQDHLQIWNNNSSAVESIVIYDQTGRLIQEHKTTLLPGAGRHYDISQITSGLYYIEMRMENEIIKNQFIKQ